MFNCDAQKSGRVTLPLVRSATRTLSLSAHRLLWAPCCAVHCVPRNRMWRLFVSVGCYSISNDVTRITSAAALKLFFITSAVVPQHLRSSGTPPQGVFFLPSPVAPVAIRVIVGPGF